MKKISISIGGLQRKYGDRRALEIAKEIGCDAVDFDLTCYDTRKKDSVYAMDEQSVRTYFEDLRLYAEPLGLAVAQTHGRIKGFINDPTEDDALVENARLDCIATKALGAPYCVMHTTTSIHMGADPDPALMHKLNYDMFTRILPFAKENGVVIATETFGDAPKLGCCDFFGNLHEFIKGYNRVCACGDYADWFKICMDTGHTHKATRFDNPSVGETIRLLGKNIVCLHLHDNDRITDQHKIPFTCTIDWNDALAALDEIGYSGIWNAEVALGRHFGKDFEIETAAFCVKVMNNVLNNP